MVFNHLKEKIHSKGPELAFFFDNERNYQKLVKGNYDKEEKAFNETRSLWVFTDELVNKNLEYIKKIHHIQIGILSTKHFERNIPDRLKHLTPEDEKKIDKLKEMNKSCDAFLFIDKSGDDEGLLKFKTNLIDYLASKRKTYSCADLEVRQNYRWSVEQMHRFCKKVRVLQDPPLPIYHFLS